MYLDDHVYTGMYLEILICLTVIIFRLAATSVLNESLKCPFTYLQIYVFLDLLGFAILFQQQ